MPYLKQEDRERLNVQLGALPLTGGDLNYIFSIISYFYFVNNGANYRAINDIVGALECAKLELYRRVAAPYEDTKIESNGDVYVIGKTPEPEKEPS